MKIIPILGTWLILCSCSGIGQELLWQSHFGGPKNDQAYGAIATIDGGYLVLGQTQSYRIDSTVGISGYLVKMDADANIQWERAFGQGYSTRVRQIFHHDNGGFIIVGSNVDKGQSQYERLYMAIVDSNGNVIKDTVYGEKAHFLFGNASQTLDGGLIVTGYTDATYSNVYLWKLDHGGTLEWWKVYAPSLTDKGQGIIQLPDGGYMITGLTSSPPSVGADIMLLRTDAKGDSLWMRQIITSYRDEAKGIFLQDNGDLIIAGQSHTNNREEVNIVRVTVEGQVLSSESFGLDNRNIMVRSAQQLPDGGVVVGGWTEFSGSRYGGYCARVTAEGALQWQKEFGAELDTISTLPTGVLAISAMEYLLLGKWFKITPTGTEGGSMFAMKIRSVITGVRDEYRPIRMDLW